MSKRTDRFVAMPPPSGDGKKTLEALRRNVQQLIESVAGYARAGSAGGSGSGLVVPESSGVASAQPIPAIAGATIEPKPGGAKITLPAISYPDLARVDVLSSTSEDVATAVVCGDVQGDCSVAGRVWSESFAFGDPIGAVRYFWVRIVAEDGSEGPFSARLSVEIRGVDYDSELENQPDLTVFDSSQSQFNLATGGFLETFEEDTLDDYWNRNDGAVTYARVTAGMRGGKALQAAGGRAWRAYKYNIPYDPDRLYRLTARVRMTVAPSDPAKDLVYIGLEGVAADGTTLLNRNGANLSSTQHYHAASAFDMGGVPVGTWKYFFGYIRGHSATPGGPSTDPNAPAAMYTGVKYVRPLFILNYDNGDGTMQIDELSLEIVDAADLHPDVDALPDGSTFQRSHGRRSAPHLANPDFEQGPLADGPASAKGGWNLIVGSAGDVTYETGSPIKGTRSLRVAGTNGGASTQVRNRVKFVCDDGEKIVLKFRARVSAGGVIGHVGVQFSKADGSGSGSGNQAVTSTSNGEYKITATAGADTAYGEVYVYFDSTGATGAVVVDKVRVRRITNLDDDAEDGSIFGRIRGDTVDTSRRPRQRQGVFIETWDDQDLSNWEDAGGSAGTSFQTGGRRGGKVLRCAGSQVWLAHKHNIPFDPDRLYRVTGRVRMTAAPTDPSKDLVYVGVVGVAEDGVTLINTAGANTQSSQHYVAAQGFDMGSIGLNTWKQFTGYFKGHGSVSVPANDPRSPSPLYAGIAYIRPMFIVNIPDGNGTMEVDEVSVEVVDARDAIPDQDFLGDGSTYGRARLARLDNGFPWVDMSEARNINRTADNISETGGRRWAAETSADVTGAHTSYDSARLSGFLAEPIARAARLGRSRNEQNLIANGYLQERDTRGISGSAVTFREDSTLPASEKLLEYPGAGYITCATAYGTVVFANGSEDYVEVEPGASYSIAAMVKAYSGSPTFYFGFDCLDAQRRYIGRYNFAAAISTLGTIASGGASGTSTVTLDPGHGWTYGAGNKFINMNAAADHSDIPNNDMYGVTGISGDVVTISGTFTQNYAAGSKVRLTYSGGTYQYHPVGGATAPAAFTEYQGIIVPWDRPNRYDDLSNEAMMRPGTRYIAPVFLVNFNGSGETAIRAVSLRKLRNSDREVADGATFGRVRNDAVDGNRRVNFAASGVINRTLDNVSDTASYARTAASRVNAGRPVIDFSEGIHAGKNLDNISDGGVFSRTHAFRGDHPLSNPTMEQGGSSATDEASGWLLAVGSASDVTWETSSPISGTRSLRIAGTNGGAYTQANNRGKIACRPGDKFVVKCKAKVSAAGVRGIIGAFFNSGGEVNTNIDSTSATDIVVNLTAPAGATVMTVFVYFSAAHSTGAVIVDEFFASKVRDLDNEVQDGVTYARPLASRVPSGRPIVDWGTDVKDGGGNTVRLSRLFDANYIDASTWVVGTTGSQTGFAVNGAAADNSIVMEAGPDGITQKLWKAVGRGISSSDGGWDASSEGVITLARHGFDRKQSHLFGVFFKPTNSVANGTVYLGCDACKNLSDSSANTNAYFAVVGMASLTLDRWYVAIGLLHGEDFAGTTSQGISGIYDFETGAKIGGVTEAEFKCDSSDDQALRTYLYYTTTTAPQVKWCRPFVIPLQNGMVPNIGALCKAALLTGLTRGASGIRLGDARNGNQVGFSNVGSRTTAQALSAADVGSDVTITIAANTQKNGSLSISNNSGTVTGRAFSDPYDVYHDDANLAGGAVSYLSPGIAITPAGASEANARVYDGYIFTPADGAGGTSGSGGGGIPP